MKETKVRTGNNGRILPRHEGMVAGKLARSTRASYHNLSRKRINKQKMWTSC